MFKYKKFFENCKIIEKYYDYLILLTNNHKFVGATNEWIIDNYYLIAEINVWIKKAIKDNKKLKATLNKTNFLYDILEELCIKNNYDIEYNDVIKKIKDYQDSPDKYLSYEVIDTIPLLLSFILVDKLTKLCIEKKYTQSEKEKIRNLVKVFEEKIKNEEEVNLSDYITIDKDIENHAYIIEQLNDSLKHLGSISNNIFFQLDKMLEDLDLNLKDLINKDQVDSINNNILVANLFNSLRRVLKIKTLDLYDKISKTEQVLKQDSLYKKMTPDSKQLYRKYLIAKSKNTKEYQYACKLLEKSSLEEKHIGFYLFKKPNLRLRSRIYLCIILITTLVISTLLSTLVSKYFVLSFLLLLIPISEIVIQLTNKIWLKIFPCEVLPKLDFSKGIPKENATMVVLPTIIKDTVKIDKMFELLEKYYLANKSNNLYFSLLGDCNQKDVIEVKEDSEIAEYGIAKANELNEKYGEAIFSFVYRKRVYNEGEGKYLGYERKRGALIHFNKLLLGKLSNSDKEKYIYVENVTNINTRIKYVITIDTDTELVLNTALNLVGTMAHPLNRPILNKEHNKVIDGYGIIQPRVNVDIESTNKSVYTQLMAGIGGFDVYSTIIPNFYQDVFKEGSFIGKGIYDLEIFDEVVSNIFPDNLILSHDLLEGNYLRCGFASDIELIDDFPSEFLVESSRQHRWARGDVQISNWLFKRVPNKNGSKVKNPLNLIEKIKIFDNIRRIFLDFSMLILIVLSFINGNPLVTLLIVLSVVFLPMLFYLKDLLQMQNKKLFTFKYYNNLIFGFLSILYRMLINIITIPYYSFLYLDAFLRSIYRMTISHKNLLNWVTAEDASKSIKSDFLSYINSFRINYFIAILLIILSLLFSPKYLLIAVILAIGFILAPIILSSFSKTNVISLEGLSTRQDEKLKDVAYRTWLFFDTYLTKENNYLIPDNIQLNRENKEELKTSPTNIGMSITSIISAYELDFINSEKAIDLLSKITTTLEKLEKWNGHLYNWYNIRTLEKINPYVVSSVDSGNLSASLVVMKEFCKKKNELSLYERINTLFKEMDFSKLYTNQDVFSIAYNTADEELSPYCYNKFASESRILSFVAIMKGDVPSKHWLSLDKTLTKYKKHKGLVSWSGTSFEYFMPLIFMKTYPNTLLDESYFFAKFCQKNYINEIDYRLPWGISESAYDELDDGLNYKYKAFATPYLKVIDEKDDRLVLSPYASILTITYDALDVYNNLKKFKRLNMYGDFGYYEAYDYTTGNRVLAYYAHHQGMILSSLANYLKDNVIQKYFHSDLKTQAFEILLKEKVQLNPVINMKVVGYKKYDYEREKIENDIRYYDYISETPQLSVLSNSRYSVLINDRGNGFSRYGTIQLNRYRKITELDYGTYLYIKDLKTGNIWSNTFAPTNVVPLKYSVVFANDRIKFSRLDNEIICQTEIVVSNEHDAEIRKYSFKNLSNQTRNLELTTYTEVIIEENIADIIHRTFRNLFVSSRYIDEYKALIMRRRNNSAKTSNFMMAKLIVDKKKYDISYETERDKFIGRGKSAYNARALNQNLSNESGTNIDPIISLRTQIDLAPKEEVTVYYVSGFSKSMEGIEAIINTYSDTYNIEKTVNYASLANNMNTKLLNISGNNIKTYNIMLNYLYQTSRHFIREERKDLLAQNSLNQSGLWRFGISGDLPIILVNIHSGESFRLAKDVIRAFEYYKSKALYIDLVIINSEIDEYKNIIKREVEQELYRMNKLFDFNATPGNVYLLEEQDLTNEEKILLNMVARLTFNSSIDASLDDAVNRMHLNNLIVDFPKRKLDVTKSKKIDTTMLDNYNGYGGFVKDTNEYVIVNQDTPTPWSNVLANQSFGSIITNNECGFTYSYNSQQFKLTSWTNDIVVNDKSEGISINDKEIEPKKCIHGFGYSTFEHSSNDYDLNMIQFVAKEDKVKFYKLNLVNTTNKIKKYIVTFWINPTLGPNEEKSSRYILSEYFDKMNAVILRNVYSTNFSGVSVFMSSTLPIISQSTDRIISKSISVEVELAPSEQKDFSFVLGTAIGLDELQDILQKYKLEERIDNEYDEVKKYWSNLLDIVKIKSPDKSFNYMMNGWYLYQTIASRLYAKAGFYQVGGAYGFRDQLQDAVNICSVIPSITKEQIIKNAMHQFKEGDVLHWWHEDNMLGLRSHYMDDFLWLVYATNKYIEITEDSKILEEEICFIEGDALLPGETEKGITYWYTKDKKSLLEHLLLCINRTINNTGENGLPLIGGGDWNDGMNKVGILGRGTSVWLGFFAYLVISDFLKVGKSYDVKLDYSKYNNYLDNLKEALNTVGWDEDYYKRAFYDNGSPLGSIKNDECQIDLISQSFAILSSVIPFERLGSVIKSVEDKLVDKDTKIIKLLDPPFKDAKNIPGYIMDYPKGIRENGGQYTHSVIWYIMALIKVGYIDRAYQYYQMINPVNRTMSQEDVNVYKIEPYVIGADIYSNYKYKGRGGWSWYTGSAGWFYNVGLTSIIGFKKEGNYLSFEPHTPSEWKNFELQYNYMDTTYKIKVNLKEKQDNIMVDGEEVKGKKIRLKNDKRIHAVVINIKGGIASDKK